MNATAELNQLRAEYQKYKRIINRRFVFMRSALDRAAKAKPNSRGFEHALHSFNGSRETVWETINLIAPLISQEEVDALNAHLRTLCLEMHNLETREISRTE